MKMIYETPECWIYEFARNDIVTTSTTIEGGLINGGENDNPDDLDMEMWDQLLIEARKEKN